jgi:L-threonylcarbamoyladenylate synthase
MADVDRVVDALLGDALAVVPTDTVYGLVCAARSRDAAADLYRLKGRETSQPTALIASSVAELVRCLPDLDDEHVRLVRALLPGPFTLVLPNPAERFGWLSERRPATIGVRVPVLPDSTAEVVARLGAVVATSANLPGEPDACRLHDVPEHILAGVAAVLDGGLLPGVPSTVVDLTGPTPVILREGAVDADATMGRLAIAHTQSLPPGDDALTRGA